MTEVTIDKAEDKVNEITEKKKRPRRKRREGTLARREAIAGYLFVLPWVIGVIAFLIMPLSNSFQYALANIKMTPKGRIISFVGYQNFTQIWFEDASFPTTIWGYVLNTLLSVPVIVVFALIIAMLLNDKIKLKGMFRLIFFLPVIVVSGPVMGMLADQGAATVPSMNVTLITGLLEGVLPGSLVTAISSLFENMIMILWYSGVQILIFLSALQKIDTTLYEAAKIDGGSGWECFWKITLPTIKPMLLLNAVYTVIFLSNNEQNSIIVMIQDAMFAASQGYGYASAMAWLYSVVVTLLVAVVAIVLMTRKDAYDRQVAKMKRKHRKDAREVRKIRRRNRRNEGKIASTTR